MLLDSNMPIELVSTNNNYGGSIPGGRKMIAERKTVDVSVAEMSVQELVHLIDEGQEILLTNGSKPLARIVPIIENNAPRIAGLHPGAISTSNDFDEPLPEEFWTAGA